jgi:hypothetical protein
MHALAVVIDRVEGLEDLLLGPDGEVVCDGRRIDGDEVAGAREDEVAAHRW